MASLRALLCGLAVVTCGCTTTRVVDGAQMASLAAGDRRAPTVLPSTNGRRVRLDPNSDVRIVRRDGSRSAVFAARALSIAPEGLMSRHRVPLAEINEADVSGLDDESQALLVETAPDGTAVMAMHDGALRLLGTGRLLVAWIDDFGLAQARRLAPESVVAVPAGCDEPGEHLVDCRDSPEGVDARALDHLRHALGARPLGSWRFYVPAQGLSPPLAGESLWRTLADGIEIRDGIRWQDVRSVEVTSVSGPKTLFGTAAVTAGAIALAPLFLIAGAAPGLSFRGDTPGPGAGVAVPGTVAMEAAAVVGTHMVGGAAAAASQSDDGPSSDGSVTLWKPGLQPVTTAAEHALFTPAARRRATVRLVGALETAADLRDRNILATTAAATLRIMDVFEIGGGARNLVLLDGPVSQRTVGFFRTGMHLDMDAHGRVAVPLSVDIGGGADVGSHFRLNLGVAFRPTNHITIAVYPMNSTWTHIKETAAASPPDGAGRWSFLTGVGVILDY